VERVRVRVRVRRRRRRRLPFGKAQIRGQGRDSVERDAGPTSAMGRSKSIKGFEAADEHTQFFEQ